MKVVRLVRLEKSDQGIMGVITIDGKICCYSLEPSDTFVNRGIYECWRHHGDKFPNTFEIRLRGHEGVVFHVGNLEHDTKGCVLTGSEPGYIDGQRGILESKKAFNLFMEMIGEDTITFVLYVENSFGG